MNNKAKTVDMLPCPFCGNQPKRFTYSGDERNSYADQVVYECVCGCKQGAMGDRSKRGYADNSKVEPQAIEAWNTRYPSPAVGGEPDQKWPNITQPAKVGGIRFGAGCSSESVIECAYRLYEYEVTPEKEAERRKHAHEVREGLLASALEVPRLNAVVDQLKARIAELEAGQGEAVAVMYANGTVLSKSDCVSESVFDICCKVQTPLYRQSHPAKSKVDPCEWTDLQVLEFMGVALRNVDIVPESTVRLSEIRQGFEFMRDKLNGGAE
ncbi:Lar-like restriction alleviation protein [Pseudomonas phage AH02]|nr:Lar-like restriction alleviation protein [Pseudomonas phage AH02]